MKNVKEIVQRIETFDYVDGCRISVNRERYKVEIYTSKTAYPLQYKYNDIKELIKILDGEVVDKDIRETVLKQNNRQLKDNLMRRWFIGDMPNHLREYYDNIGKGWIQKHIRIKPNLP